MLSYLTCWFGLLAEHPKELVAYLSTLDTTSHFLFCSSHNYASTVSDSVRLAPKYSAVEASRPQGGQPYHQEHMHTARPFTSKVGYNSPRSGYLRSYTVARDTK